MRRAERVNHPTIILLMRDQRADADNRVIDVLWKSFAQVRREFRPRFAFVTIRHSEAREVRHGFNVPYENVGHVMRAWRILQHRRDFLCG